jgi:ribose transport system ATP-binding protein
MLDIVKSYGAVRAVRGVGFTVDSGEIVAIVGENGAGKSTIMKILAGIETADAGQVLIADEEVEIGTPMRARQLGISLVPQELTLCLDMTVRENILLGDFPTTGPGLVDSARLDAEAARRLELLGAPGVETTAIVRDLTFVERAFVQIARAIRDDTRILIMDEPTAPMSQAEVDQLLAVLRTLAGRGVAVIYISHRLEEIVQLAQRAVVMRDGSVARELSGRDLTLDQLVASMLGTELAPTGSARKRARLGEDLLEAVHLRGSALHDLSLTVAAGEIVAVYGVLGSGFEELGACIVDGKVAAGGRIVVNGRDITGQGVPAAIAAGLGYVPPERRTQGLHLEGTVAQNLILGMLRALSRRGIVDGRAVRSTVARWIDDLRIKTPTPDTQVGALSGGSQQKVLVARWLAAGSTVLVLEEPTRGVDIATKREIYEALRAKTAEGTAVLVVSSDLEEIVEIADRVLVMRGGVLVAELAEADRVLIAAAALQPAPTL